MTAHATSVSYSNPTHFAAGNVEAFLMEVYISLPPLPPPSLPPSHRSRRYLPHVVGRLRLYLLLGLLDHVAHGRYRGRPRVGRRGAIIVGGPGRRHGVSIPRECASAPGPSWSPPLERHVPRFAVGRPEPAAGYGMYETVPYEVHGIVQDVIHGAWYGT